MTKRRRTEMKKEMLNRIEVGTRQLEEEREREETFGEEYGESKESIRRGREKKRKTHEKIGEGKCEMAEKREN